MDKKMNVGERINDTKKEIAQLSEELERLIQSNAGLSRINVDRGTSHNLENVSSRKSTKVISEKLAEKISNNETATLKSSISVRAVNSGIKNKTNSDLPCTKKNITQSKEATREYMRQQREKREEQKKRTDSKMKIDQELKKQKLQELQQKSLALVQRNLQLKRERSKSRERKQQIRIDKTNLGSDNAGVPPIKKSLNNLKISKDSNVKLGKQKNIPEELNEDTSTNIKIGRNNDQVSSNTSHNSNNSKEKGLEGNEDGRKLDAMPEIKNFSNTDLNLAARKIQLFYKNFLLKKQEKEGQQLKHKVETPITESKETQTSAPKQIEFPAWLQPATLDPYPCNFINTVKKKLQLVVNSPVRSKDVGVQSSIRMNKNNLRTSHENSQKLRTEMSGLNEKVDAHSQKGTNLDADALQHYALTNFNDRFPQNNKDNLRSDSESDTSKNIPEISTESALVSDERLFNIGGNTSVLPINTEKLKNLTLRRAMKGDVSKKSYTFNFSEEFDTNNHETSSKKTHIESVSGKKSNAPRDSRAPSNLSEKIEPLSPSFTSEKDKNTLKSISQEEISTKESKYSQLIEELSLRTKVHSSQEQFNRSNHIGKNNSGKNFDTKLSENRSARTSSISEIPDDRNSSHLSSLGSKQSHNLMKNEKSLENNEIESKLRSVNYIDKQSDNLYNQTSDSTETIVSTSIESLISATSFQNSQSTSVDMKNRKEKYEENIQSLLNSLTNNKYKLSSDTHEISPDLPEDDKSTNKLKVSRMYSHNHDVNTKLDESNINNAINEPIESIYHNFNVKPELKTLENSSYIDDNKVNSQMVKNFTSRLVESKNNTNEIHLKFEAEVHLLNDFNESLKQFMAVEKAFESLKIKNENSFRNSTKTSSTHILPKENKLSSSLSRHMGSTINTSRGSDLNDSYLGEDDLLQSHLKSTNNFEVSSMQISGNNSLFSNENIPNNLAGLSIKMFEQFIKDEDIRIENLKTIIKIREQALLDRTKGELAWLEIQRKHLKQTGKINEASLVKKKQRGILLKHQQERREMQRLKQIQKIQSNERKTILKEQKNLIKAKLTSEKLLSEMKIQTPRKQRHSGPMKVLKTGESLSETSVSKMTSDGEEIYSIKRSHSIKMSEIDISQELIFKQEKKDFEKNGVNEDIDKMRKALLVRQDSLMKRRKAVEDLLKRHQKLLEEEKKIEELEMAANAIIMQLPSMSREPKIKSRLKEINQKKSSPSDNSQNGTYQIQPPHKSIIEEMVLSNTDQSGITKSNISQSEYSFNTFYKNAKSTIDKMQANQKKGDITSASSNFEKEGSIEYSENFESEQPLEAESTKNDISSISELIEDFTQIEHGISMFSKQFNEMTSLNTSTNMEKLEDHTLSPDIVYLSKDKSTISPKHTTYTEMVVKEDIHTKNEKTDLSTGTETYKEDIQTSNIISEILKSSVSNKTSEISGLILTEELNEELQNVGVPSALSDPSRNSTEIDNRESSSVNAEELLIFKEQTKDSEDISSKIEIVEEIVAPEKQSESTSIVEDRENLISIHSQLQKSQTQIQDDLNITEELPDSMNQISDISIIPTKPDHWRELSENEIQIENNSSLTKVPSTKDERSSFENINNDSFNINISKELVSDNRSSDNEEVPKIFSEVIESEELSIKQIGTEVCIQIPIQLEPQCSSNDIILSDMEKLSTSENEEEIGEINEPLPESIISLELAQEVSEEGIQEIIPEEHLSNSPHHELSQNTVNMISSPKDETYKDIPSIETNSELYNTEIKTDTTSKDISEIKDVLDFNPGIDLPYEENFSSPPKSNETGETAIDNENSKDSMKKSINSQEANKYGVTDGSFEGSESLVEDIEASKVEINEKLETQRQCSLSKTEVVEDSFSDEESEENKLHDKIDVTSEKISSDDSSTNSYTDDFEDDKEEISSIQEILDIAEKSSSNSITKVEQANKVPDSDKVLMVKIDWNSDLSKKEAKITVMEDGSNNISNIQPIQKREESEKIMSPIQQRVSQILENTVGLQKSPRDKNTHYQDYYVTTYEDITPVNSPDSVSPVKSNQLASINTYTNEAEELLKKQLAIELEIKHLEQQQKEQLPFVYMREIPNKPPPPYTPPSAQIQTSSILPNRSEDLKEICRYSAKVLYNAYLSNNLHAVTFSEIDFKTINETNSSKECCLFIFDLCREIAENHYNRFQNKKVPAWLKLPEESRLMLGKPYTCHQLEYHIYSKVKELLGLEKANFKENPIIRWSKKKKDHVDEILVLESQAEEQEWLNYDKDELMVKNEVTDAIFDILLNETVEIYKNIFS